MKRLKNNSYAPSPSSHENASRKNRAVVFSRSNWFSTGSDFDAYSLRCCLASPLLHSCSRIEAYFIFPHCSRATKTLRVFKIAKNSSSYNGLPIVLLHRYLICMPCHCSTSGGEKIIFLIALKFYFKKLIIC